MKSMDLINFLQMTFTGAIMCATVTAAIAAIYIGVVQNGISNESLKINNFVEVFMMPQVVTNATNEVIGWKVLIKNVSSYPIYLSSYELNGVKTDIGNTPIPNDSGSWYAVPIPPDVQSKGQFS